MSVRAYKVLIPATLEKSPSFNIWHDGDLLECFNNNGKYHESEGGDIIEIEVNTIKKVLKKFKWEKKDYRKEQLKKDIKGLSNSEWVCYQCY